jgi:hypothetical protein
MLDINGLFISLSNVRQRQAKSKIYLKLSSGYSEIRICGFMLAWIFPMKLLAKKEEMRV